MTQPNTPNAEAEALAKAAFAKHPGSVGRALRELVSQLDKRDDSHSYENLLFREQAVGAFEKLLGRLEALAAQKCIMKFAIENDANQGDVARERIAQLDAEMVALVAVDDVASPIDLDLDGEELEDEDELDLEDEYDEEGDFIADPEVIAPASELVALTRVGELRHALIAGIVCLTDTDNMGEVHHQFVTVNQGFIRHVVGQTVPLREPTTTVFHAFDLIHRVTVDIQPDMFTGTAHVIASFVEPREGLAVTRDGHLVLDAKAGPLFVASLPKEMPAYSLSVPAVGGINEEGRLTGVYPFRPVTRDVNRDNDLSMSR